MKIEAAVDNVRLQCSIVSHIKCCTGLSTVRLRLFANSNKYVTATPSLLEAATEYLSTS
jgi:hypothetical protein